MGFTLSPSQFQDPAFHRLPALPPPPGVTPNFAHPEDRGPVLVFVGGILSALMLIFIGVRAYTKLFIVRRVSWDDLTISFSAFSAFGLYIMFVWVETQNGPVGKHQWETTLGDFLTNRFFVPAYVLEVTTSPTLWATKFTFFLLYLRIFWPMRWLRIAVYIGATLCTAFYLGVFVAQISLSTPAPGQTWMASFLSAREVKMIKTAIPVASIGLIIDLFLLIVPSVAVCKLQLGFIRKLGLMLMFGTGSAAVVASAMSIYVRYINAHSLDQTWTLLDVILMYLIEIQVGVLTACMPSFAQMLRHHLPALKEFGSRVTSKRISLRLKKNTWPQLNMPRWPKIIKPHGQKTGAPGEKKPQFYSPNAKFAETRSWIPPQEFNLDSPSSVRTSIRGGRWQPVNPDGIYLKHDIEHSWSHMDIGNAEIVRGRRTSLL